MTQEALRMALEFVESINLGSRSASVEQQRQVITAIKEALAQPEQETVGYWKEHAQGMQRDYDLLLADYEKLTQPEQEPVAHPVIAGALFDFMGWLTSRKVRIVLSSADNASPAADAIRDFANMRGLSLDDAKVQDWNTTPTQRTWVGLTGEEAMDVTRKEGHELLDFIYEYGTGSEGVEERIVAICKAIDAKLKQKNGYAEEKNT